MEVYKITCRANGKVYIGSTKLDKMTRWGDLSSSSSHLSRVRDGNKSPLYEDIRLYGSDQFEIETLELVEGNRLDAYRREDFWIKKFWDELGSNMMYNQYNSACGHNDWSVPNDPESQRKAAESRRAKYGSANGACMTPEAQLKARNTKLERYGNLYPFSNNPDAKKSQAQKVSNKIEDTKIGDVLIGYSEVLDRLLDEGYDITFSVVKSIVSGYISRRSMSKYHDIINRFKIIKKKKKEE